jgi:hypothetical protein
MYVFVVYYVSTYRSVKTGTYMVHKMKKIVGSSTAVFQFAQLVTVLGRNVGHNMPFQN